MARDLISNLPEWGLVYDEQDIRGREAFDEDGTRLGMVTNLVADTDLRLIVAIVLDGGREYPADWVDIEPDRVRVHTSSAPAVAAVVVGTPALVMVGGNGYVWSDADRAFLDARRSAYAGRAWDDSLEADLRADYDADHGEGMWERVKANVREAWIDTKSGAREAWEETKDAADKAWDGTKKAVESAEHALVGHESSPPADDWARESAYFRDWHDRTHAGSNYADYEPFYRYGYESGRRDVYLGRDWDSLEADMRTDYEGRYGVGTWERVKDSVHEGFQRARNAIAGG
ncbi:MAG: PRC-barrel domain-containing protein [Bacteroidetes bacterium]|nr:PRC-barrel domain-containing protein [Bacteroidota bacterium]